MCQSQGTGGGDDLLMGLELAGAVPLLLSPRSQPRLFLSLQGQQWGERGRRWQAGKAGQTWLLLSTTQAVPTIFW